MPRLDRRQAEILLDGVGAQALATRTADLAEPQFHHPEITFGWGYCRVGIQTRKIPGLHENDFIMAAKVNERHKGATAGRI